MQSFGQHEEKMASSSYRSTRQLNLLRLTKGQSAKTFALTCTDCGMVKSTKELHSAKAWTPMVTESGMIKLLKELQPRNAFSPMCVIEFGMVKLTKEMQS